MLLYPLYALLFASAGLSTAEISSLFAIWSGTAFLLEVPSGIWADAVSRRLPLTLAPLLSGVGFATWVLAPSYPTFALGFVLWGAQGALQSGALEALVYEELDHAGAASRYAEVMGRATALGTVAVGAAMGLATPVFAAGGFEAVGAASVIACLAAAAVGATFPEHRTATSVSDTLGMRAHVVMVRAGLHRMRDPRLRRAVLVVPAVTAVWGSLEEYVPLLALETGVERDTVPLFALLVTAAMALGAMLAGRASALSAHGFAVALAGAALALALGSLSLVPTGFILVAVAFAAFQALTVVADARLQDAIEGPARSTVTSLAGLLTEVAVLAVFAAYAAGSAFAGHAALFAAAAAAYVIIAAALARRPASQRRREPALR